MELEAICRGLKPLTDKQHIGSKISFKTMHSELSYSDFRTSLGSEFPLYWFSRTIYRILPQVN